jgi:hypothetical protein
MSIVSGLGKSLRDFFGTPEPETDAPKYPPLTPEERRVWNDVQGILRARDGNDPLLNQVRRDQKETILEAMEEAEANGMNPQRAAVKAFWGENPGGGRKAVVQICQ